MRYARGWDGGDRDVTLAALVACRRNRDEDASVAATETGRRRTNAVGKAASERREVALALWTEAAICG